MWGYPVLLFFFFSGTALRSMRPLVNQKRHLAKRIAIEMNLGDARFAGETMETLPTIYVTDATTTTGKSCGSDGSALPAIMILRRRSIMGAIQIGTRIWILLILNRDGGDPAPARTGWDVEETSRLPRGASHLL